MRYFKPVFAVCALSFLLVGCDTAQEQLGLNRKAPDEFAVLRRAPLAMPPNYALRPPAPGAARPQELETANQAAQAVFGGVEAAPAAPANGEEFLLQQAGADAADPNIRTVVDSETAEFVDKNQPVIDKIMDIGDDTPKASVVDAEKEAERLKKNAEEGKPVTEGETPSEIK